MSSKIKILAVTGSRADYGLLRWTLMRIKNDSSLSLDICVTGMHLSSTYGYTYKEILADGLKIFRKIPILSEADTPFDISLAISQAVKSFSKVYKQIKPNLILLVGDRFESFAAAVAAVPFMIPIAHCHGGEVTAGAIDEAFRHSMTKMAHLHFVSTKEYKRRIIQLGENPDRVFISGALGIENISHMKLLDKSELTSSLQLQFKAQSFLVTFHPATLEYQNAARQFAELILALEDFPEATIIITKPNADTGSRVLLKLIARYVKKHPGRVFAFTSLGTLRYMSLLKIVDVVIGNSSSGIIEAPSFRVPTVNIGRRQEGRVKGQTVIDVPPIRKNIKEAILKATSKAFKKSIKNAKNPYDHGDASEVIVSKIKAANFERIIHKKFFDIERRKNRS